jgi:hypothetical protein
MPRAADRAAPRRAGRRRAGRAHCLTKFFRSPEQGLRARVKTCRMTPPASRPTVNRPTLNLGALEQRRGTTSLRGDARRVPAPVSHLRNEYPPGYLEQLARPLTHRGGTPAVGRPGRPSMRASGGGAGVR